MTEPEPSRKPLLHCPSINLERKRYNLKSKNRPVLPTPNGFRPIINIGSHIHRISRKIHSMLTIKYIVSSSGTAFKGNICS